MSKLIDNKQIIHIASEIVVIIGITFYFSSKNRKLLEHIEDLSQRLEEQEDLIQKHEQIIKQLVQVVNTRVSTNPPKPSIHQEYSYSKSQPFNQDQYSNSKSHIRKKYTKKHKKKSISPSYQNKDDYIDNTQIVELSDSEQDSDLDAEIADELNELIDDNSSLKKEE